MNRKLFGLAALLGLAAPLSGCLTQGELGGGSFGYSCSSGASDAVCDGAFPGQELTLPKKMAVGAKFELSFHTNTDSGAGGYLPDSASGEMILPVGNGFAFQKAGFGAILARDVNGRVGDFVHLQAADVEKVAVVQTSAALTELKLTVGDIATLHARPLDSAGETLAGSVSFTWAVQGDSSLLDVATHKDGAVEVSNVADLTAKAAGSLDLVVQGHEKSTTVHVVIGGQP